MSRRTRPAAQEPTLAAALSRAAAAAPRGVVVLDLDSTLLDNRPRQARILQDYGRVAGLPALLEARAEHWQGWDLRLAMANAGLTPAEVAAHAGPARRFWAEWFFTSAYCRLDAALPGAAAFVRALASAGARIAYVTGRPARMIEGTLHVFRREGFPAPDGAGVHLLMKDDLALDDDAWKEVAAARVERLGPVVAAFDNEPAHVNLYARRFPEALVVHLATDHSARPIAVLPGIPAIADFCSGPLTEEEPSAAAGVP
ncbi:MULTISPECIES: haloacid dehalogenase-like hydrolase [unclassified Anaeromyxobacter]|uniref:haloacid dehalogenase-like hydrolase n=1 Tax=unclassified Anaeromyxobacter TaxID=2620896 RepID=UPI001F56FB2E|nr:MULTISPECIES: HAD family hydrolase [unclassified Anaeromyxobacter]